MIININIEDIIFDLQKHKDWNNYIDKLKSNFHLLRFSSGRDSYAFGLEGIIDGNKIRLTRTVKQNNGFWCWKQRSNIFPEFSNLEKEFKKLFLEKVHFCPYCGKIPLISYDNDNGEKCGTFDLDHYYPKSKYSYLTYSLYNLIPICKVCNQMKGQKNFYNVKNYYHPFFGKIHDKHFDLTTSFDDEVNFSNDGIGNFMWNKNPVNDDLIKIYNIDKIYLNSQDTRNDIAFIVEKESKILSYGSRLKSIGITNPKVLFFNNFYPEKSEDILKFANGKLKKNMINSLKI